MHVFKPKRMKDGKRWTSEFWSGRYRLSDDPRWTTVSLQVRQRDVAMRKLAEIVHREERRQQGMLVDEVEAGAASRPLPGHLDDFEQDLFARGRSKSYICKVVPRCHRLLEECNWQRVGDITADRFIAWRAKEDLGPRTANHYLDAFRCFLEWMNRCGRIQSNPLMRVQKAETRGYERVVRRAYTLDELHRLLAVAGPRAPIYLGAALTGLRFRELGQLKCGDVELSGPEPMLRLPAAIQKTREYKALPLAAEVAEAWAPLVAGRSTTVRLFARGMPAHTTFNADLERANIPKHDKQGRSVDFHSFRKTFTTFLQVAGVDRRVLMEVARHKDSRLTDLIYTDVERLDLRSAVNRLPVLGAYEPVQPAPQQVNAHQDAHDTVPESHSTSLWGTNGAERQRAKNHGSRVEKPQNKTPKGLQNSNGRKRRGGDSNPREPEGSTGFRIQRDQPLCHLSSGTGKECTP